jgi:hypothetical protein
MDGALVGVWRIRNQPKGYEKSHTEKGFFERIEQIYENVAGYSISGAGVPVASSHFEFGCPDPFTGGKMKT